MALLSLSASAYALATALPVVPPIGPNTRYGSEKISVKGGKNKVTVSGWDFTPGMQVFIGTWDGNRWIAGKWLGATQRLPRCRRCGPGGTISDTYSNENCGTTYTVYAFDEATRTFSPGVQVFVTCIL